MTTRTDILNTLPEPQGDPQTRKAPSAERADAEAEALDKARNGASMANYEAIMTGFTEKGIDPADIVPRENVFTVYAWNRLGRKVRKGEHGVRIQTRRPMERTDPDTGKVERFSVAKTAHVFHESQTEPWAIAD